MKEDDCGFNGDGTSIYGGMKGIATLFGDGGHSAGKYTATGHTTFDAMTATDVAQAMGLAPGVALARAAWLTSPLGFALMFCRLAATAGGIVVMPDNTGRLRPHFFGFAVILTGHHQLSDADRQAHCGLRRSLPRSHTRRSQRSHPVRVS